MITARKFVLRGLAAAACSLSLLGMVAPSAMAFQKKPDAKGKPAAKAAKKAMYECPKCHHKMMADADKKGMQCGHCKVDLVKVKAGAKKAEAKETMFECSMCHMDMTAAKAKESKMECPHCKTPLKPKK